MTSSNILKNIVNTSNLKPAVVIQATLSFLSLSLAEKQICFGLLLLSCTRKVQQAAGKGYSTNILYCSFFFFFLSLADSGCNNSNLHLPSFSAISSISCGYYEITEMTPHTAFYWCSHQEFLYFQGQEQKHFCSTWQ